MTREDRELQTASLTLASTRISRVMQARFNRLERPLTLRQYRMLFRIREGYDSPTAIRRLMGLTPPAVSESVDILVRRELVTRTRSSEDGRRVVLKLTTEGEVALKAATEVTYEIADDFVGQLPKELRKQVGAISEAFCEIAAEELRNSLPQAKPFPE